MKEAHQQPAQSTSTPSQKALNYTRRPGQNISPVVQLFSYFRHGFPGRPWTECDYAAIHHAAPLLVKDGFFSCFLTVSHQFLAVVPSLFSFCYLVRSRNLPRRTFSGSKKRDPFGLGPSIVVPLSSPFIIQPFFRLESYSSTIDHCARWSPSLFPATTNSPRLARARLGRVLLSLLRSAPTSQHP